MRLQTQHGERGCKKQALLLGALLLSASQIVNAQAVNSPATPVSAPAAARTTNSVAQNARASAARRILISIPDRKLALMENGEVVKVYAIAVGAKATPSPSGEFKIINRVTDPTWYGSDDGKPVPAGPANPLGTRWMGLSKKGYGIHGTNAPSSIGKRASHGCIRMTKKDLEELFELVRIGDVVTLEAQRTTEVAAVFGGPQVPAMPAAKPAVAAGPVMVAAALPTGNL